jgi:flagellum-specific ATP synthase
VLESVSRVMPDIVPRQVLDLAADARDVIATYREAEDLITIGAYKPGMNPRVDRAVALYDDLIAFLKQKADQRVSLEDSWRALAQIMQKVPVKK